MGPNGAVKVERALAGKPGNASNQERGKDTSKYLMQIKVVTHPTLQVDVIVNRQKTNNG